MAIVKVEGRVSRLLGAKGFTLQERINNETTGQSFERPWTIWGEQPTENSIVEVVGQLKTEVARNYETKEIMIAQITGQPYVSSTVNATSIKVLKEGKPVEATQWEAPEQGAPF
jgi:hypothetical protein